MVRATYYPNSPYYYTAQNSYYLGYWQSPAILPSSQDQIVTVAPRYLHRPDLLSYDLYGSPRLWWIFAILNPDIIKDPVFDLQPGIEIRVPPASSLQGYLGNT